MFGITRDDIPKAIFGAIVQLAVLGAIQLGIPVVTEPGPIRDISVVGLSALALVLGFLVIMRWLHRGQGAAVSARTQQRPSDGPRVFEPSVVQEPTESVLRKKWKDAEARVAGAEAHSRKVDRARAEMEEREGLLHKALDTTITWLYRRENWDGLTEDGRHTEPAPKDIWADGKYAQLGLNGVAYEPPKTVPPEPGFKHQEASVPVSGQPDRLPASPPIIEDRRTTQDRQYESERSALIQAGDDLAQGLRGIQECPTVEPSTATAGALAQRGHDWIERTDMFRTRWHAEPSSILSGVAAMALVTGVDPEENRYFAEHTAPAPVWRQRLVLGIEYRLDQLRRQEEKRSSFR